MIVHCLSCGKCVSSNLHNCPYCISEINDLTLELNGILQGENFKEKMKGIALGLVQKQSI